MSNKGKLGGARKGAGRPKEVGVTRAAKPSPTTTIRVPHAVAEEWRTRRQIDWEARLAKETSAQPESIPAPSVLAAESSMLPASTFPPAMPLLDWLAAGSPVGVQIIYPTEQHVTNNRESFVAIK